MSLPNVSFTFDSSFLSTLATPSWDAFIIFFFAGAVVLYSFFASRERLAVILLSVYAALAVSLHTPLLQNAFAVMSASDQVLYRLGSFLILFLVLYTVFSHNMSLRSDLGHKWYQAFLLSFFQVGLLTSSIFLFIPRELFSSSLTDAFFREDIVRSLWMTAPIGAMLLMRPRPREGLAR